MGDELGDNAPTRARGIDRLIQILDYLHESGRPQRPKDIVTGINAPKSSVYEIVNRLVETKILEPFDDDGRVFLGRKLHFFGMQYLDKFDLLRQAKPVVEALSEETNETAQLCMCDGNKYIVALAQAGARHFKISSDLGHPIPLTWTASGRLLVSDMSENELLEFIPKEDFILPNGTTIEPEQFFAEVTGAKREDFYSCNSILDGYTKCYSAPVRDQNGSCLAALCIVTPREEASQHHNEFREILTRYATQLSSTLGGKL